ncbi:MAG TPA: proline--tRNA ligase [Firmicutes bacterium]|nr:proline--tRNA ligase [Bacillota bacterium]
MRMSQLFAPTLREVPAEAETISHQYLLRAGMIRKIAAGIYIYLPLAQRVLQKIERIVREEMDKQGGQELLLPALHPADLWLESGRWDVYGKELFRLKDRHERDYCLGPTHEEVITDLVRREVSSYRQLPLLLYQIQTKFRDEIRPRFGLIRGREFTMKDLYSFDKDEEGLEVSYRKMYHAYSEVFRRCALEFRVVEADSGAIGGSASHEFVVIAETGESEIAYCDNCAYAANVERAEAARDVTESAEPRRELELVSTPGVTTIAEVADFLAVDPKQMIKTLIYLAIDKEEYYPVVVLLRGDREVNEVKLQNHLGCLHLALADADTVREITGAPVGFAGPVGLKDVRLIADVEVPSIVNGVCGANRADYHWVNVNPGRDFVVTEVADIHKVVAGDKCKVCGHALKTTRGIEVGHIFKLGTKYSEAMGATFLDEKGNKKPFVMGCYGIGIPRTMAAAIEQNHDDKGIIWPMPIAPYQVVVVPVNSRVEEQMKVAERLYRDMLEAGIEVVLDDRDERAGVKFNDADLIGFPLRVTIGSRSLQEGKVEIKKRRTGETMPVDIEEAVATLQELIRAEMTKGVSL